MWMIRCIVLAASCAVAGAALLRLCRVRRAYSRRRLWRTLSGAVAASFDGPGISVVASGAADAEQIAGLLAAEYARYEVVLVLDARRRTALFRETVARYRMIAVDCRLSEELPVPQIRGLYRSRLRCFRRLVLIDCASSRTEVALDAAVGVASYDWLLPVYGGRRLVPGAVERLAAEAGDGPAGSIESIESGVGEPAVLVARDRVVAEGGFRRGLCRRIPRTRRRRLYEPLLRVSAPRREHRALQWCGAVVLLAVFAAACVGGRWLAASVAATLMLIAAARRQVDLLLEEWAAPAQSVVSEPRDLSRKY